MQKIREIGAPPWNREDIKRSIPEFIEVYEGRPIKDNHYGMGIIHMFATWFIVNQLRPKCIVESGVLKGQGTWLLEQSAPGAQLICIEPVQERIEYRAENAKYLVEDFSQHNWDELDRENTLLFFDDHQNAFERLKLIDKLGFRNVIFEDNYSIRHGDCYSLKQVLMGGGFDPPKKYYGRRDKYLKKVKRLINRKWVGYVPPNTEDRKYVQKTLQLYYEFPPVFKLEKTRWGDDWTDDIFPTQPPLYDTVDDQCLQPFYDTAAGYTWICYCQLTD